MEENNPNGELIKTKKNIKKFGNFKQIFQKSIFSSVVNENINDTIDVKNKKLEEKKSKENKIILKVEIENYQFLKSSRLVTVVFDPEQTVRQALLQIAKKPQVALDVDDALHNYEIFIPNKSGGITMSNDKKLSFYNLNDKDILILKRKSSNFDNNTEIFASQGVIYKATSQPSISKSPTPSNFKSIAHTLSLRNFKNDSISQPEKTSVNLRTRARSSSSAPVPEDSKKKTFGVSLPESLKNGSLFGVPNVVNRTIQYLQHYGLDIPDIFIKSAPEKEVQAIRKSFDQGEDLSLLTTSNLNPYTVADVLKLFLKMLPEPLLTFNFYDYLINEFIKINNEEEQLKNFRNFINYHLPFENLVLLAKLIPFLRHIYDHNVNNRMYLDRIKLIFGPILLRPDPNLKISEAEISKYDSVIKTIIALCLQYHEILFISPIQDEPILLPGETIIEKIDKVLTHLSAMEVESHTEQSFDGLGILWITNFQLIWKQAYTEDQSNVFQIQIPFGNIYQIRKFGKVKNKGVSGKVMVYTKDFFTQIFGFKEGGSKIAYTIIYHMTFGKSTIELFAFTYFKRCMEDANVLIKDHESEDINGWTLYNTLQNEFKRQGLLLNRRKWRITTINNSYQICSFYPKEMIVPSNISDETIEKISKFRIGGCFPAITWSSSRNKSSIFRAGVPIPPTSSNIQQRIEAENKLLDTILAMNPTNGDKLRVIDTGILQIWQLQIFSNCEFSSVGLGNNLVIRDCLNLVEKLVKTNPSESSYNSWLEQIKIMLDAANTVVEYIESGESVLIQSSVDNDSIFGLLSICQILLDSYYRTIKGFEILIEKEWCYFGYPFALRFGLNLKKNEPDSRVPNFILFMDCVWQLWKQFPTSFEFNEEFLLHILKHCYSCLFGTFLCNNDKHRTSVNIQSDSFSLWTEINKHSENFLNPFFKKESSNFTLKPTHDVILWRQYYFHRSQSYILFQKSIPNQIKNYIIHNNYIELNLEKNNLCVLCDEAKKLKNLEVLFLGKNNFNTIPTEILFMKNIKKISFRNNQFTVIHDEFFSLFTSELKNLEELYLNSNQLIYLPSSIGDFHKLQHLDLSDNLFEMLPPTLTKINSLKTLLVSKNQLSKFPFLDSSQLSNLEVLDLSKNSIQQLPEMIDIPSLNKLRLSQNNIKELTIMKLPNLVELDLKRNLLNKIPENFFQYMFSTLKKLELKSNKLSTLPSQIRNLQSLTSLNIEKNNLTHITEEILELQSLIKLNLNHNKLMELPQDIDKLSKLESFLINHNQLTSLPLSIGKITSLKVLDISENKLDTIPPTIALLSNLNVDKGFFFVKNKLRLIPKSMIMGGPQSVFGYLKDLLKGYDKLYRMRLMVVGQENVGKTSLCNCLRKKYANHKDNMLTISTDGINIDTWVISATIDTEEGKQKKNIELTMWDFAGQEIYYSTHQFFMSKRSLYLLVWNLTSDPENSKIDFWLHSIKAKAKSVPIFIIGTHADDPTITNESTLYLFTKLQKKYSNMFPNLELYFRAVSCATNEGIKKLKNDIEEVILKQKHMGESIPTSFTMLEKQLIEETNKRVPPIITRDEFVKIATSCNITDERQLSRASKILHELGSLVHFDGDPKLKNFVILNPRWLTNLMSTILTTKHNFAKDGILAHQHLLQIWKPPLYPPEFHNLLLSLLENFEIAFPLKPFDENYSGISLIPSLLPEKKPDNMQWPKYCPDNNLEFSRHYKFDFIPYGLFGRIIVRLLHLTNSSEFYWRNGILLNLDTGEKILVEILPNENFIIITSRVASKIGNHVTIPRYIIEAIETLIRHWYKINMKVFIACVHCIEQKFEHPYLFSLEMCQTYAVTGKQHINCNQNDIITPVKLDDLVPDLTMKDVNGSRINFSELEIEDILGEGGAAIVYKGKWRNELVAIKKLRFGTKEDLTPPASINSEINKAEDEEDTFSETFKEFRREVSVMSGLEHPNLVILKGICLEPLCIVTEFMAGGDLYHFLHNENNEIEWSLRIKIAIDIASGMSFLHNAKPPIIHRDLKSPNILLNSNITDPSILVAKVSDFGLSGTLLTVSTGEVANPRWLAPEIMQKEEFTEKADIYSFGVILWELISRKDFFENIKFNNEIEKLVIAGQRPPIPDCPKLYYQLIENSWSQNPKERPSFQEIKKQLYILKENNLNNNQSNSNNLDNQNNNLNNPNNNQNLDN